MPILGTLSASGGYRQSSPLSTLGNPIYAKGASRWRAATGSAYGAVVKYNRNSRPLWIATITGATSHTVTGVVTRPNRDIIAVGYAGVSGSALTASFNHSTGTLAATQAMKGVDGFIAYYDASGMVQWTARISTNDAGNTVTDQILGVAVDASGNVYVTGTGGGVDTASIVAYNTNGTTGASIPSSVATLANAFVVKYSASGVVQWMTRLSSAREDKGNAIAVDGSGNVYVAGGTGDTISSSMSVFNADGSLFTTLPALARPIAFLVKYDTNGVGLWIARPCVATAGNGYGLALTLDSTGSVYVGGETRGPATFSVFNADGTSFGTYTTTISYQAFLVKYNPSGVVQWRSLGFGGTYSIIYGLATDRTDSIYAAGLCSGTPLTAMNVDGTAFAPGITATGLSGRSAFAAKYTTAGTVQAIGPACYVVEQNIVNDQWRSVAVDRNGVIVLGGRIGQTTSAYNRFILRDATSSSTTTLVAGACAVFTFNPTGTFRWTQGTDAIANSVATDVDCNIIAGHTATATSFFCDANPPIVGRIPPLPASSPRFYYLTKYSSNADPQWVAQIQFTSTSWDLGGVSADSSGNIYVVFSFSVGTVTPYSVTSPTKSLMNPASGVAAGSLTMIGPGNYGHAIFKYNANGVVQWGTRIRSPEDRLSSAQGYVGANGDLYVMFVYYGQATVVAESVGGTPTVTLPGVGTEGSSSGNNMGIVKYDANGTILWGTRIAADVNISGRGIGGGGMFVDSSGSLFITGSVNTTCTIYNSNGTTWGQIAPRLTIGNRDAFVLKYNSNGTAAWRALVASTETNNDAGYAVTTDSAGNVLVTGQYNAATSTLTTNIYNASGTLFTTLTNSGLGDAFLVKYTSAGVGVWARAMSTTAGADIGRRVVTDSTNAVIVGFNPYNASSQITAGSLTIANIGGGNSTPCAVVVKFTAAGAASWIALGAGTNRAQQSNIFYVGVDSANSVYVLLNGGVDGHFFVDGNGANFGGVPGSPARISLVKLNASGVVQWMLPAPGFSSMDYTRDDPPVFVASDGTFYFVGLPY